MKNAGDQRPFRPLAGLFFDQRGHGDDLAQIRGVFADCRAQLLQNLPKPVNHSFRHIAGRRLPGKVIGVGEQIPFERFGFRVEIADERSVPGDFHKIGFRNGELLGDGPGDVEDVKTFGNRQRVVAYLAVDEFPVDVPGAERPVEKVLPGLDALPGTKRHIKGQERRPIFKHSSLLKAAGGRSNARPGRNLHDRLAPITLVGGHDVLGEPAAGHQQGQGEDEEDLQFQPALQRFPPSFPGNCC